MINADDQCFIDEIVCTTNSTLRQEKVLNRLQDMPLADIADSIIRLALELDDAVETIHCQNAGADW